MNMLPDGRAASPEIYTDQVYTEANLVFSDVVMAARKQLADTWAYPNFSAEDAAGTFDRLYFGIFRFMMTENGRAMTHEFTPALAALTMDNDRERNIIDHLPRARRLALPTRLHDQSGIQSWLVTTKPEIVLYDVLATRAFLVDFGRKAIILGLRIVGDESHKPLR